MSRFLLACLVVGCHAQEATPTTPTPSAVDAALAVPSPEEAGARAAPSASTSAAPPDAAPAPSAEFCIDAAGQRVVIALKISGCGLKLGKTRTDEQRPGVVHVLFSTKSSCTRMEPTNVELMTDPLQQRRFQLIVEEDGGHVHAEQMVTTTSLPVCGRKR
jgi:hypothetical protein